MTNEEWVKFITGVKELRQSLELSVREVALKLGVRPSHYYNLENEPTAVVVNKLRSVINKVTGEEME